ncbi:hypothetical protein GH714_040144 [Hevea brasiliensis]|uniref:CCHC-type domain-containing protein n=1 Tax=Hevea brasiliensis TaxID=3981 RepID=A0A6A6MPQ5_HEVBR|nr:hypothetical protein GH714_040144 [Hevea brasiliensis]
MNSLPIIPKVPTRTANCKVFGGTKLSIKNRIRVQVLQTLFEAKNMALKVEMMKYERVLHDSYPRYDEDNERAVVGKEEEKGSHGALIVAKGKKTSNENPTGCVNKASSSNLPKGKNPYVKPTPNKCYRCNEEGHRSHECPRRKTVNFIKKQREFCCEPEEGEDEDDDFEFKESLGKKLMFLQNVEEESSNIHEELEGKQLEVTIGALVVLPQTMVILKEKLINP